jgi:hypothetical protein
VIFNAVARPRMPPPMIVRSYRDAIGFHWSATISSRPD